MADHNILPECFADTTLVRILGYQSPAHHFSKGAVANAMQKNMAGRLAIAVVDYDKPRKGLDPKYFKEFELLESVPGLNLLKHSKHEHYVIQVVPVFEKWIFEAAETAKVEPAAYGFNTWQQLKKITKKSSVESHRGFKDFLNTIKQKGNNPVAQLEAWLKRLNPQ